MISHELGEIVCLNNHRYLFAFLLKNNRYSTIFSTFLPIMILIISYIYKGKSNEFIFTHCFNVISYY